MMSNARKIEPNFLVITVGFEFQSKKEALICEDGLVIFR